jgi:hypothetical protein
MQGKKIQPMPQGRQDVSLVGRWVVTVQRGSQSRDRLWRNDVGRRFGASNPGLEILQIQILETQADTLP